MRIVLNSREPFGIAGLWDKWLVPNGKELFTYTILTTAANDWMRSLHERMPCIVAREYETKWLDCSLSADRVGEWIFPYQTGLIEAYAVSKAVNIPSNDSPECIQPAGTT